NNYFLTGSTYGTDIFEIKGTSAINGTINFANNAAAGGTNIVKYGRGIGNASVNPNGGTGSISFDSTVSAQDVYWQTGSSGALVVKIRGDATDSITVNNDLVSNSWGVSSALSKISFSDGSSVNLGQPAAGQGAPLTFTWLGANNNYFLTGST